MLSLNETQYSNLYSTQNDLEEFLSNASVILIDTPDYKWFHDVSIVFLFDKDIAGLYLKMGIQLAVKNYFAGGEISLLFFDEENNHCLSIIDKLTADAINIKEVKYKDGDFELLQSLKGRGQIVFNWGWYENEDIRLVPLSSLRPEIKFSPFQISYLNNSERQSSFLLTFSASN